jgi:peptide/nickel transport system permease protein
VADVLSERKAGRKRASWPIEALIRLVKEKPLGTAGGIITLLLLLTGIFANILAPYGFNDMDTEHFMEAPSGQFPLGTDNLGRDMLSRVIYGARISVIVGLTGAALSTFVSVIIGIMCGYFGGAFDMIVQRIVDGWMCFPGLVLLLILMSIIGGGMWPVIVTLGLLLGISGSRIIRGATLSIKENLYVAAAVAIGRPSRGILFRHILPNIMAPIIILFTVRVPEVILTEAALSFLGYGIPPPTPSWGGMLSGSSRTYMYLAPWMAVWPGLALSIVVYGVNIFGDALRDILDPRLTGGIGRYGIRVEKKVGKEVKPGSS